MTLLCFTVLQLGEEIVLVFVLLVIALLFFLKVDLFRGFTLPDSPMFRQVFGGQLIGQASFYSS